MKPEEMLLKKEERVSFSLRALFEQYGYRKFKMSKFEAVSYTHLTLPTTSRV